MSRLAFRAAAAVVGVALLAIYLTAALFVVDVLRFLWTARPDLPVLLALLAAVAVGSAYCSYGIGRALVGFATVLALPALLALSGLTAGSAWIRGRPGDRSGPFAPLSAYKRTEDPIERWLSTHPSIDERVERLRRRAEEQGPTRRIPAGPSRGLPDGDCRVGDETRDTRFGRDCGGACRRAAVRLRVARARDAATEGSREAGEA